MNYERQVLLRCNLSRFQTNQIKCFSAIKTQRRGVCSLLKLTWQNSHADQVTAVNAFETLRNNSFRAEQARSLRGPISRTAGAILLTGNNHQRRAFRLILHRCVVNTHALAGRVKHRDAAFNTRHHQVFDAYVCERAAHHYFMITTTGTVAIEIFNCDSLCLQVKAGRRVWFDRARSEEHTSELPSRFGIS